MNSDIDSLHEIQNTNPLALLVRDSELLCAQYRSHGSGQGMDMTPDEQRMWMAEAAEVLRQFATHAGAGIRAESAAAAIGHADLLYDLPSLLARRNWVAQTAQELRNLQEQARQAAGDSAGFGSAGIWNLLMRNGRRPVSFKMAGHTPRRWPNVTPPSGDHRDGRPR